MSKLCEGRVIAVTGAGRGIGRAHALELAAHGAHVLVNDLGAEVDGAGSSTGPAGEVVEEIRAAGGTAHANGDDIATWDGAQNFVNAAIGAFGRLDGIVNNAGILRDRVVVSLTDDDWDSVIQVHLNGTFYTMKWAATYWREEVKAGRPVDGRIINTSSGSGLFGNPGQSNYGAAKAGIASLSLIAAMELARYGVTVNVVCPAARTRMTAGLGGHSDLMSTVIDGFDVMDPANNSPLVAWLASAESKDITGQTFEVAGGHIGVLEGWRRGPAVDQFDRWDAPALGAVIPGLVAESAPATAAFPLPGTYRA